MFIFKPHADLNIDRGVTVTYLSSGSLPGLQHRWIAVCPDQNKQDFQHGLWIDFRKNISCDSEYFVHGKMTFYLKWRVYTHEIKNALMMIIYMYLILTKWTQISFAINWLMVVFNQDTSSFPKLCSVRTDTLFYVHVSSL